MTKRKRNQIGFSFFFEVIPLRLERKTYCLEGSCSIQLSYGTDLVLIKSGAKIVQTERISKFI